MQKPLNDDPWRVWNSSEYQDDPDAPHNGIDGDDPLKPWNDIAGSEDDLTDEERRGYGLDTSTFNNDSD